MTARPAEPFYFSLDGESSPSLLGWLHLPATNNATNLGVVICNPLGQEFMCAHRSLRHFAESLTNAGAAVLRFDYHGTGDSPGTDFDPQRVEAWLASVQAGADTLRRVAGVEHLCFFGIRFGATLAALAAAKRNDVVGLITIAAVTSGRAYVRELRALQLAMDSKEGGESETDQILESAGFLFTKETQSAIGAIDLLATNDAPAKRALIIDRSDLPTNDRWPTHLRNKGVDVTQLSIDGYVEMMLAPHDAIVPQRMVDIVTEWTTQLFSGAMTNSNSSTIDIRSFDIRSLSRHTDFVAPIEDRSESITEEAVFVNDSLRMFAIVTRPTQTNSMQSKPSKVIVLLNSGAVHRMGPSRTYVTLARNWAANGHVVLRVDISGIGDSPPRPGEPENSVYSARALEDVATIMNYVERRFGLADCHAVGICSGAYHSFKAAVQGAPIKSAIMINPLTFFWKEGMSLQYPAYRVAADVERYKTNMFRLGPWLKLLRGRVNLVELSHVLMHQASTVCMRFVREAAHLLNIHLRNDLGHELQIAAQKPVDMMFVFSAQDPGLQVLLQQGGATVGRLKRKGKLAIQTVELANHTFTSLQTREKLVQILTQRFGRA